MTNTLKNQGANTMRRVPYEGLDLPNDAMTGMSMNDQAPRTAAGAAPRAAAPAAAAPAAPAATPRTMSGMSLNSHQRSNSTVLTVAGVGLAAVAAVGLAPLLNRGTHVAPVAPSAVKSAATTPDLSPVRPTAPGVSTPQAPTILNREPVVPVQVVEDAEIPAPKRKPQYVPVPVVPPPALPPIVRESLDAPSQHGSLKDGPYEWELGTTTLTPPPVVVDTRDYRRCPNTAFEKLALFPFVPDYCYDYVGVPYNGPDYSRRDWSGGRYYRESRRYRADDYQKPQKEHRHKRWKRWKHHNHEHGGSGGGSKIEHPRNDDRGGAYQGEDSRGYVPPHLRGGSGGRTPPHLRGGSRGGRDVPPHLRGGSGSGSRTPPHLRGGSSGRDMAPRNFRRGDHRGGSRGGGHNHGGGQRGGGEGRGGDRG